MESRNDTEEIKEGDIVIVTEWYYNQLMITPIKLPAKARVIYSGKTSSHREWALEILEQNRDPEEIWYFRRHEFYLDTPLYDMASALKLIK